MAPLDDEPGVLPLHDVVGGADGKAVEKPSDAQKLEAANKIPIDEKITSLMGAIHSNAANIGLDLKKVPAVSGGGAPADAGKKLTADEQIRRHKANAK